MCFVSYCCFEFTPNVYVKLILLFSILNLFFLFSRCYSFLEETFALKEPVDDNLKCTLSWVSCRVRIDLFNCYQGHLKIYMNNITSCSFKKGELSPETENPNQLKQHVCMNMFRGLPTVPKFKGFQIINTRTQALYPNILRFKETKVIARRFS